MRGQPRKFVTCEQINTVDDDTGQFLAFLDTAGQLVLLVRRAELVALARYEEPPF